MDFAAIKDWISIEHTMEVIQVYKSLGPAAGVLLPMAEAIFPFVPLFLLIMANVNAFGLWWGFLFSWVGATVGSMLVFYVFHTFGQKKLFHFMQRHKHVNRLMEWIDRRGFGPLFLLLCFPFTPSALVNIVAGLSKITPLKYWLVIMASKLVMIFTISYIGHDVVSLIHQPKKTIIILIFIFVLWIAGKQIEKKLALKGTQERVSE